MKLNAYAIFDVKTLQYHPPFFALTDGAATRIVFEVANDVETSLGRHPSDYVIYCVGDYDDSSGMLNALSPNRHVADVIALVRPSPAPELFDISPSKRLPASSTDGAR